LFNSSNRHFPIKLAVLLLLFTQFACQKDKTVPLFELLPPTQTGINFTNTLTENDSLNIIQYLYHYNGGGVAIGDINNDGLSDIYFTANQERNRLYLNKGAMQFEDITDKAGVAGSGNWSTGVSMVDINADGWLDIYICQVGNYKAFKGKNQLFINQKDGTFKEMAADYGLDHEGFSTQAAFLDYDLDGDLDMYLLCHSVHSTTGFRDTSLRKVPNLAAGDKLFRNDLNPTPLVSPISSPKKVQRLQRGKNLLQINNSNSIIKTSSNSKTSTISNETISPSGGGLRGKKPYFTEVTQQAGILNGISGYGLGVAVGDIDQNGCPDLYIGNDFHENDFLYLNNCDGTFSEKSTEVFGHTSKFSMGNDLSDFNNDGLLDVVTMDMKPADEIVYRNSAGNDDYGIYQYKLGFGYSDQLPRNMLQLNRGIQTNSPTPLQRGENLSFSKKNTNIKGSSYQATNSLSNLKDENISFSSKLTNETVSPSGGGEEKKKIFFSEIGQLAGIAATDWSWSALFADFDNDGWKDLHITNGIVRRPNDLDYLKYTSNQQIQASATDLELAVQMPAGKVANFIYKNKQQLSFGDVTKQWGLDRPSWSNGAAYADLDNDGDLDLVVNNINEPAFIYENQSRQQTNDNYLTIKLKGNLNNPFGVGTKVTFYNYDHLQHQEFYPTRGWQSSVDYRMHFGLGKSDTIDYLVVEWGDGKKEVVEGIAANQTLLLDYGNAQKTAFALSNLGLNHVFETILVSDTSKLSDMRSFGLNFQHRENRFYDNNRERLIPHLLSTEGPRLAVEDVNKDGLEDVFIGGASGQSGALFIQQKNGSFIQNNPTDLVTTNQSEDSDVVFFDADSDGDQDLYIGSGGNEFYGKNGALKDRLYLNDGSGNFAQKIGALPEIFNQTSCVKPADFDNDGDLDLFIGSRSISVNYGNSPDSYLLENDGQGNFKISTTAFEKLGMVTDATWTDIDADNDLDLLVVGEWMPITIFVNQNGKLSNQQSLITNHSNGWWNTIESADFDKDGDLDFLIGNLGLNSNLKASAKEPVHLYLKDIDKNLSNDPILTYYQEGKEYTFSGLDELGMQLTYLKKEYRQYDKFAKSTFLEVFPRKIIKGARQLTANNFASVYLENDNGQLILKDLPRAAQFAPVHSITIDDFDKDGHLDVILGGNFHEMQPAIGRMDASYGTFLKGDGKGGFTAIDNASSGLWLEGQTRAMDIIKIGNQPYILSARNNNTLGLIKY